MRLTISFVALLLVASAATTVVLENFAMARAGDMAARIAVFVGAPIALLALAILGRMILMVYAARRTLKQP